MRTKAIELTPARIERFWAFVDRRGPDECWPWLKNFHTEGYGMYREWSGNRCVVKFYAHRMSLLIAGEDIADLVVRHDCDNPPCVNPRHLRTGMQADNVRDAIDRGRSNASGLAIGQSGQWPPRPCRRCSAVVSAGRKRYCTTCRAVVTREILRRYHAKRRVA